MLESGATGSVPGSHLTGVRLYIVTYRVDDDAKTVDVLSIRHGARRPERWFGTRQIRI